METVLEQRIVAVRRFGRFYTSVLGLLRANLLETPYSLTEARIIFELAQEERTELSSLRATLDVDAGYLSRLVAGLEAKDVLRRERSSADGRRQVILLTDHGRREFDELDRRSAAQVESLLSRSSEDEQKRLVAAMREIENVLHPGAASQHRGSPRTLAGGSRLGR